MTACLLSVGGCHIYHVSMYEVATPEWENWCYPHGHEISIKFYVDNLKLKKVRIISVNVVGTK